MREHEHVLRQRGASEADTRRSSVPYISNKERNNTVTQKHARLALFRATRSPVRGAWPPARLALTRPASASRLAERAVCPPGAALPARCAAQSCEKQWGLLSLGIVQRGGECSTATVQWREGLMGASACAACSPAPCRGMLFVRLAPASQRCPWRRAACRNTSAAMNGARDASCRAWSERLEARGCRSTLRRMRAAKAARQATGIVATRSPLLQLCFADQKRPSFAF